jgi:hypothetical protein
MVNQWTFGFTAEGQRSRDAKICQKTLPLRLFAPLRQILSFLAFATVSHAQTQSDYYRIETYELPKGVNFEASGLAVTAEGKLAVGLRKGEVWIEGKKGFQLFASGLHEILGLAWHDGALYATQRAEVTKLRDSDGDGKADEYLTASTGWGVSGAYHEYAYGPVFDAQGNAYTSLNCSMGKAWKGAGDESTHPLWRGWVVRMTPEGKAGAVVRWISVRHAALGRMRMAKSLSRINKATGCRPRRCFTFAKAHTFRMRTRFLTRCGRSHR